MSACLLLLLPLLADPAGMEHVQVPDGRHVRMILKAPGAGSVQFACSLDGFVPHDARTRDRRTWEIRLPSRRAFSYFYLVDGRTWVPDGACREPGDYGQGNCIYEPGM
ncbi:MAG TPA: hypothetical protein PKM35_11880 [Holophaga sp.]|nr:hypothetical protein [Holophaga sp.]HPS66206.1 hypothetical protein [Holophaga sp.]